ncbi:LamG-like jellyroll fold domain-containing protein [Flavobacterium proteolyticum]|uniref:Choice-of-anchor D domain-containing protein n=1 Tax=Flavobacterium proteolyticum TaxID=2911683 RepID=A0ABR9WRH4_9FLAO|nr:LamG-like jellyroll fold domain-containing protein [Flavobacterium proteolyticum]MBE9575094.1 choice-of-anchor D domain-containing protein [Flavobacterium proteolyticum]
MERKITQKFHKELIVLYCLFFFSIAKAQTRISYQGFDSKPEDTWSYTSTLNSGTIQTNTSTFVSSPNSLRFGGSNSSTPDDPNISFTNVDISSFSNVYVSLHFSSNGSPDDNDDLYLDVSYNNGASYTTSVKLIDGKNSTTSDVYAFNHVASAGNTVGSPYTFAIPNGNTQVKIRIRFDELNGTSNTSDYYFIDNVSLYGNQAGNHLEVLGLNNTNIAHNSSASSINGTDFGETQIVSDPVIRTFTIKNIGTNTINLTGTPLVQIIGSSDFTVIQNPSSSINTNNSSTFKIKFNPSSIGTKTAQVSVASNSDDVSPFLFDITGKGIQTFYDSDNDGIFDNVDIDDDNDGIRDDIEESNCNSLNGNKVNYKFLNETFGAGGRTTINTTYDAYTSYCYEDGSAGVNTPECPDLSTTDLNDGKYTIGPTPDGTASWVNTYWYKGGDHTGNPNGRMAIFNASYTPGIFYTASITGALPNIPITYSFWVLNIDRTDAAGIATRLRPDVRVEFRDMSNNLITYIETGDIPPTSPAGDWQHFTADINLNVSAFQVIFINNETGGMGNDLALDDILITQTLCDLDGDNIADVFDLDSDNDGIPDVVEVGLGNLSDGKAYLYQWVDVNQNGMHDVAESHIVPDNDGDGAPNYLDLDSDNDSVFDVDESWAGNINAYAGYENGDGDINGDGAGDGPESETFRNKDTNGDGNLEGFGDGILDIYDYAFNIYGNDNQGTNVAPFSYYVKDTDGDGIPDYLDVMSNGVTFDISHTLYASLDANNDGIIDGTTDSDGDGILDAFDTNNAVFGSPRDLERKLFISFDGRNDYATDNNIITNWSNASLMAWININPAFSSEGIVVGQDKFYIKINNSKEVEVVANGTTLSNNLALNSAQWIHVGAVYDGSNELLKLFVNGEMIASTSVSGTISDTSLFTIGKNSITNTQFFKGKIDEVRLFNVALTDSQFQKMVYQEIQDNSSQTRGAIIPKDIPSLPWINLVRYYRMDNYKDDVIDNHTTSTIDTAPGARIYNVKTIAVQEAPMPFVTEQTGDFPTAVNSIQKEIRGLDIADYDWSIVHVKHNINSNINHIDLGMIVDSNVLIDVVNDTKLQNDWYLKLDGKIDLHDYSQLLQTTDSDLDPTSIGTIEKDQKGTGNLYNYNYWSSPVSSVASSTNNNTGFTVGSVLRDGTNAANPQNISWTTGLNGVANPLRLARYWLYKFTNLTSEYANWQQINENTVLQSGQAYTMKGSGIVAPPNIQLQNYVFTGKPNNGLINHNGIQIGINNINLVGNPYPSALDANEFIGDNLNSITGTLYFWEHYASNNTHVLSGYQGGYAARNLVGGVPPVSPALISGLGSSTRIPGRYIPVAQGYFVKGNSNGGQITFQNSQRKFVKETSTSSNEMFRNNNEKTNPQNSNEEEIPDNYTRLRLGYTGSTNFHRQLLIGFMNENANDEYNLGYDGEIIDLQPDDVYFQTGNYKLVIQGVGYFYSNAIYPLTVKSSQSGTVTFMIDGLENFDLNQPIYIHDNTNDSYNDIRTSNFTVVLPAGEINDRFSLRFSNQTLSNNEFENSQNMVFFNSESHQLEIINPKNTEIEEATLFSILGQKINNWKVNSSENNIKLSVKNVANGIYIVKIKTNDNKYLSQKIIIR